MYAAASGHSTLGIPKSVGKEFVQAEDSDLAAAGIMFVDPQGNVLFCKRSDTGHWAFPGGGVEKNETPDYAARREAVEELGHLPSWKLDFVHRGTTGGVDFTTFRQEVLRQFKPRLNDEHTEHLWAPLSDAPQPLHPGIENMMKKSMASDEPSLNQQEANYVFPYKGNDPCGQCSMFRAARDGQHDDQCTLVKGCIEPTGHCDHFDRGKVSNDSKFGLAFDKASVRIEDRDGRLHVAITHISKANVCPYIGKEIPDYKKLGLDPDKVYQLLRHPEELERAAPTFNNLPLMRKHIHQSADQPHKEEIVGSTGTDAVFVAPYLDNSLVVWDAEAIKLIESDKKKELSSAYYYRLDLTPGEYMGVKFDGIMRDIVGNHVAIVEEGRAGSDVVVGDSKESLMAARKTGLTRTGLLMRGALSAYLRPMLAQDAKIDLNSLLKGVSSKNLTQRKDSIAAGLLRITEGKLAEDANLQDVTGLLDALEKEVKEEKGLDAETDPNGALPIHEKDEDEEEADDEPGEREEMAERIKAKEKEGKDAAYDFLKQKGMSDDDIEAVKEMLGHNEESEDEEPEKGLGKGEEGLGSGDKHSKDRRPARDRRSAKDRRRARDAEPAPHLKPDTVSRSAMDAALKKVREDTIQLQRDIRRAEDEVKPYVGELAEDAACPEDVYKNALIAMDIDVEGVHPSAYRHIVLAQPTKDKAKPAPRTATDSAANKGFTERFPGLSIPGSAG